MRTKCFGCNLSKYEFYAWVPPWVGVHCLQCKNAQFFVSPSSLMAIFRFWYAIFGRVAFCRNYFFYFVAIEKLSVAWRNFNFLLIQGNERKFAQWNELHSQSFEITKTIFCKVRNLDRAFDANDFTKKNFLHGILNRSPFNGQDFVYFLIQFLETHPSQTYARQISVSLNKKKTFKIQCPQN